MRTAILHCLTEMNRELSIRVKDLRILHNEKHTEKSSVVENLLLLQRKDLGS